jgi:hypothetical protein
MGNTLPVDMTDGSTTVRTVRSASGALLVKVKRGRGKDGAHAYFFDGAGGRINTNGEPVRARSCSTRIEWDLGEPEARMAASFDLPGAIALASRSRTFARALKDVLAEGWEIVAAGPPGVHKGPHLVVLEPPALVAHLIHVVPLARALRAPLAVADPADPTFAHDNAIQYLRWDGAAHVDAAIARDEILADGGPDIGGPGLRGDQLHFFEGFRRGLFTHAEAAERIGLSADSPEARGFSPAVGPRIAQIFARAFLPPPPPTTVLPNALIATIERARAASPGTGLASVAQDGLRVDVRRTRVLISLDRGGAESYGAFAAYYGFGTAHHVNSSSTPLATVAYGATMYATYEVGTGALRFVTLTREGE